MNTTTQRLMRSRSDKMIAGVAGGIGQYLAIDSVIIRLVFVALAVSGIGLLLYPILWAIMPLENGIAANTAQSAGRSYQQGGQPQNDPDESGHEVPIQNITPPDNSADTQVRRNRVLGVVLVGIGTFLIFSKTLPWLAPFIVPALLVGAGILLLRRST